MEQPETQSAVGSTRLLADGSWSSCHGRKAAKVWFSNGEQINNVEHEIVCVKEYLGDRDEIWMVLMREGKELARHNTRYVESIQWESANE